MAYVVDWITKVISIPAADLEVVGSGEYNLNLATDFHYELRRLEWEFDEGLWWENILEYTNPKIIAGTKFAAFVEIINGYTIVFDPSAVAVNLVGANTNAGELVITPANGVSIRPQNSAGLSVIASSASSVSSIDSNQLNANLNIINENVQLASLIIPATEDLVFATPPTAPTNFLVVAGDGVVSISYDAPTDDGGSAITAYVILRSDNGSPFVVIESNLNLSYEDVSAVNGTIYSYVARADNVAGPGELTTVEVVTPQPAAVSAPIYDGIDQYAELGTPWIHPELTDWFIEFKVIMNASGTFATLVSSRTDFATGSIHYEITVTDSDRFLFRVGRGFPVAQATFNFVVGTEYLVRAEVTSSGTLGTLYVDGVEENAFAIDTYSIPTVTRIAALPTPSIIEPAAATIWDVKFTDISNIANSRSYLSNELSGDQLVDSLGNGPTDATLFNGVTRVAV